MSCRLLDDFSRLPGSRRTCTHRRMLRLPLRSGDIPGSLQVHRSEEDRMESVISDSANSSPIIVTRLPRAPQRLSVLKLGAGDRWISSSSSTIRGVRYLRVLQRPFLRDRGRTRLGIYYQGSTHHCIPWILPGPTESEGRIVARKLERTGENDSNT